MLQQLNKKYLNFSLLHIIISFYFVIFLLPLTAEILPSLEIVLLSVENV